MSDLLGKPIRGETLFGQEESELALWVALIFEHSSSPQLTKKDLTELVAAHWHRGMRLLAEQIGNWDEEPHSFLLHLANEETFLPMEAETF
ncbi:hypothetical protein AEAC466_10670 [Asticcacaulis sp. AC466]|nr:hypothetical protein AEAC466_10670 [Asticcacaulis sp. AC466]